MVESNTQDQFQTWLAHMDDALDAFFILVPEHLRNLLDGTVSSLNNLESLLLTRYSSISQTRQQSEMPFIDGAARYVGEVIRVCTASKWTIENTDKNFIFFGVPILRGGKIGRMPAVCPLSLVTASVDRRTGNYLSKIAANLSN